MQLTLSSCSGEVIISLLARILPEFINWGPYTMTSLKMMALQRAVTSEHLYCKEGMSEWLPISQLFTKENAWMLGGSCSGTSAGTSSHLTASIIVLVVSVTMCIFSLPFAVVAVVQASRAKGAMETDTEKGRLLAESAYFWLIVSYVIMGLCLATFVFCCIFT